MNIFQRLASHAALIRARIWGHGFPSSARTGYADVPGASISQCGATMRGNQQSSARLAASCANVLTTHGPMFHRILFKNMTNFEQFFVHVLIPYTQNFSPRIRPAKVAPGVTTVHRTHVEG